MSKVCVICNKKPGFGNNRSHSMVATRRRFNPNLQQMRILLNGMPHARLRLHPLPQERQGHQSGLGATRPGRPVALARPRKRAHQAGHLDRGGGGLGALVAGAAAGPRLRLLLGVDR